ncbi:hypothetical protein [Paraburkholderia strydomiana]|uniref:hypothetical protein n=1 Tax=Paraburkholderia strydomiana TaxID=1245417 RepID=UPI001BECF24C|nr:hypothetical protein [Paraburkholderia strydomiana]MBT2794824.1 hypothetical protein [Paraburkholderia strydomiana]
MKASMKTYALARALVEANVDIAVVNGRAEVSWDACNRCGPDAPRNFRSDPLPSSRSPKGNGRSQSPAAIRSREIVVRLSAVANMHEVGVKGGKKLFFQPLA